jgi:hypothetical protein
MSALSVFVLGLLNSFCFFPYPHVHDERVESFLKKKNEFFVILFFLFSFPSFLFWESVILLSGQTWIESRRITCTLPLTEYILRTGYPFSPPL